MGSGCGGERSKWDDEAVKDSMAGKNTGFSREILEKVRPQVEAGRRARIGEMARERIEKHIEKGPEKEPEEKLTPERVEKMIKDEFHSWPKGIRERVHNYYYRDIEKGRVLGRGDERFGKWIGEIYSHKGIENPVIETRETVTHEFCHVVWRDLMSKEEQQRWKDCHRKAKERDNLVTSYAGVSPKEFFCENMSKFKWEPELLKEINPEAFRLAQEKYISNEVERIQEQLKEGGVATFY